MRRPVKNHLTLKRLTRAVLAVPFAKPVARHVTKFAIQKLPLSRKNKQRCYNLLAVDATSTWPATCQILVPGGGRLSLELDLTDQLSRDWYYWGYSHYERETVSLWSRLLDNASIVFDVGANIGMYTLLAAARLQRRGEVYAFEPNPAVFNWLSHNVKLNKFEHVHFVQLALCDADGERSFFLPKDRAWTNGSLIEGFTDQTQPFSVQAMRFDTYCSKTGIAKVDLIKIDVEGAELEVLTGMGSLLEKWKPDIICEVLEDYAQPLNEFFGRTAYRKFLISSDGLQETSVLRPHREFRDYYLSCAPLRGV
jgi:FkbM family methyltransferase